MYPAMLVWTALLLVTPASAPAQKQSRLVVESAHKPSTPTVHAWLPPLSARPRMPYWRRNQCPFESGCDFGLWQACEALPVRALPDFKAETIYRLAPLERFRTLRADMSVTRAGSARTE